MKHNSSYMNPYAAGFGLGLVLLASYVLMGRGLGASGAFASVVSWGVNEVAPSLVPGNGFFEKYLDPERAAHPLRDWLVFEVIGVFIGGISSGFIAGRLKFCIERGKHISDPTRLVSAFVGGILMAAGAQLARGCTSGQALSGGALLNLGSWVSMMCIFGGAYLLAYLFRRFWI